MRAIGVSLVSLMALAGPALSATCYQQNAAGGSIPYECVRGEEHPVDAPSLGGTNIIIPEPPDFEAIEKLMEQPAAVPAVPARPAQGH